MEIECVRPGVTVTSGPPNVKRCQPVWSGGEVSVRVALATNAPVTLPCTTVSVRVSEKGAL